MAVRRCGGIRADVGVPRPARRARHTAGYLLLQGLRYQPTIRCRGEGAGLRTPCDSIRMAMACRGREMSYRRTMRRAPVIATLSLLTSAATAFAGDAWVLWRHYIPINS